jgi:hypothetical protein
MAGSSILNLELEELRKNVSREAREGGEFSWSEEVDFADALHVAVAVEGCRKKYFHDAQGEREREEALADGEDVGVIVLSGEARGFFVPAEGAANAAEAVGDHGFAVAGAAENDGALKFAARHGLGRGADEVGIIDALGVRRAEVGHFVPVLNEPALDGFLVVKPGVIGCKDDSHSVQLPKDGRRAGGEKELNGARISER